MTVLEKRDEGLAARIGAVIAYLWSMTRIDVPVDLIDRLSVDRANLLANMFRAICFAGLNTMGLWAVDFWSSRSHPA